MNQKRVNPYSSVHFHKGYTSDRVRYPILTVTKLPKDALETIRAAIKPLVTGVEAEKFIFDKHIHPATVDTSLPQMVANHQLGWSYTWIDQQHRAGVLKYKGTEVTLFYKRQITEEEPIPGDPLPEGWLQEPQDAWQRLDLLGPSAKQANAILKAKHERLNEEVSVLRQQNQAKEVLADSATTALYNLQVEHENLKKRNTRLVERLSVITEHVPGAKINKWVEAKQREKDKLAKRKIRAAERLKKALDEQKKKRAKREKKIRKRVSKYNPVVRRRVLAAAKAKLKRRKKK